MFIPIKVQCRFGVPQVGFVDEIYDRRDANDVAAWHLNSGLYPQISVETVDGVESDGIEARELLEHLSEINTEAREIAKAMKKKQFA